MLFLGGRKGYYFAFCIRFGIATTTAFVFRFTVAELITTVSTGRSAATYSSKIRWSPSKEVLRVRFSSHSSGMRSYPSSADRVATRANSFNSSNSVIDVEMPRIRSSAAPGATTSLGDPSQFLTADFPMGAKFDIPSIAAPCSPLHLHMHGRLLLAQAKCHVRHSRQFHFWISNHLSRY
ncbi:hypothetical protein SAMN05428948_2802 [Massilia sp. CF038]|nr:hypothetical protein SAMN05428948_2802 [Massilia sp. CF038]